MQTKKESTMKYWFDTEFIEDGKTIDLISIGIVAEDGREFYAECSEANLFLASDWVKENVLPHLWSRAKNKTLPNTWTQMGGYGGLLTRKEMRNKIALFCDPVVWGKPEFWAYYADYDWVVLCQLFGKMIDLPKDWPMYCMDIKQFAVMLGNPALPEQKDNEHHALADAKWNKQAWMFLWKQIDREGYESFQQWFMDSAPE